tara:strand:+ start:1431 stop:2039 length:609 start_codon:yes stop_codon:yes gene_type:complete
MLLVIDNYDSFTFNLVQYLGELAVDYPLADNIRVERNDAINVDEIKLINPEALLLSPGPGNPNESGICLELLEKLSPHLPTLGVCLGHQAFAQVYGGNIVHARNLMHGKTSEVFHNGTGLFLDLPNPLIATRYHSLVVEKESLPTCLEITAWLEDGTIMGLMHKEFHHIQGVQFHPESVLTESGHHLLSNFLNIAQANQSNC